MPARSSDRHVSVRQVAALKTFEYAIVRRDRVKAALPTAEALLERIPQCRAEWEGRGGTLSRLRKLVSHAPDARQRAGRADRPAARGDRPTRCSRSAAATIGA